MAQDDRVSVVVLTYNRLDELTRTLRHLAALPEQPRIIVVDNGSDHDAARRQVAGLPSVELVHSGCNLGAAGRNIGVARVRTPYVAFCDDDTWYAPHALRQACDLLDAHPRVGAVSARVLVGPELREDPACERMARSPLAMRELPGPALISFMAGAVVMRTQAFREVGGYEPRLFLGAEEALMGLDLAAKGWHMVYAHHVVLHHHPSTLRDSAQRRLLLARNRMWIAWLRLPAGAAWRETVRILRDTDGSGEAAVALKEAMHGLGWVLTHRRPVPRHVHDMHRCVFSPTQRRMGTSLAAAPIDRG